MQRERLQIWSPAAFALFLTVMMAYWQFRFFEMGHLPSGAFGLLLHIPVIIGLLCITLDRQQKSINGLAAEVRRLSDTIERHGNPDESAD